MNNNYEALGFRRLSDSEILQGGFNPFKMIGKDWMLVTAGTADGYNTMTASWGAMGVIWGKNAAITVIRPQRHTKKFIDESELFTLSFFGGEERQALAYCGKYSGRDVDKAKETGLVPFELDGSVSFEQAKVIMVCRKLYAQELDPKCFIDKDSDTDWYPDKDYHTAYVGEILAAYCK